MKIKKGDFVTRKSYEHDTVFKVMNVKGDKCYLKGMDVRLYADSPMDDLKIVTEEERSELEMNVEDRRAVQPDC